MAMRTVTTGRRPRARTNVATAVNGGACVRVLEPETVFLGLYLGRRSVKVPMLPVVSNGETETARIMTLETIDGESLCNVA